MRPVTVRARQGQTRTCTYCRDPLDGDLAQVDCRGCGVGLHLECREESFRCPTIGCSGPWADRARRPGQAIEPPPVTLRAQTWQERLRRFGPGAIIALLIGAPLTLAVVDRVRMQRARLGYSSQGEIGYLIERLEHGSPADRAAARVGLISLEPKTLSHLVYPLSRSSGYARREAVNILRTKMKTPADLMGLIMELHTYHQGPIKLVVEVLQTTPLPAFDDGHVRVLIETLPTATWTRILDLHAVPEAVIRASMPDALLSEAKRRAIEDYLRDRPRR